MTYHGPLGVVMMFIAVVFTGSLLGALNQNKIKWDGFRISILNILMLFMLLVYIAGALMLRSTAGASALPLEAYTALMMLSAIMGTGAFALLSDQLIAWGKKRPLG